MYTRIKHNLVKKNLLNHIKGGQQSSGLSESVTSTIYSNSDLKRLDRQKIGRGLIILGQAFIIIGERLAGE